MSGELCRWVVVQDGMRLTTTRLATETEVMARLSHGQTIVRESEWSGQDLPPPVVPAESAALAQFPGGVETPSIIIPHADTAGHDYELTVVDGVAVATQISASPRKSEAEREQLKAQRAQVVSAKLAQLKALKGKSSAKDIADRLDAIESILGLS